MSEGIGVSQPIVEANQLEGMVKQMLADAMAKQKAEADKFSDNLAKHQKLVGEAHEKIVHGPQSGAPVSADVIELGELLRGSPRLEKPVLAFAKALAADLNKTIDERIAAFTCGSPTAVPPVDNPEAAAQAAGLTS